MEPAWKIRNPRPLPVLPEPVWRRAGDDVRARTLPDRFAYYPRAWALADLVSTAATPLTVALSAEWGRGKTTLLETVCFILERPPANEPWRKVHVLRYHPWRFRLETFEDVWLSMVEDLRHQVRSDPGRWEAVSRKGFLQASRNARLLSFSRRVLGALGSLSIPYLSPLAGSLRKAFLEERVPKPDYAFFAESRDAFHRLVEAAGHRCLLVVDDVDRCDPTVIVEILRAVEVFARSENLVCLLAMDRDVVTRSLIRRFELLERSEEQAQEYLHKIVQLSVTPPRIEQKNIGGFGRLAAGPLGELGASAPAGVFEAPRPEGLWAGMHREELGEHNEFLARWLCYNPRLYEKFWLVFDFRSSVVTAETGRKCDPFMTAAQSVIEVRWPEWNWIAYRYPAAEEAFKNALARETADWDTERRTLTDEHPVLTKFVANDEICRFYREYYRCHPRHDDTGHLRLGERRSRVHRDPGPASR